MRITEAYKRRTIKAILKYYVEMDEPDLEFASEFKEIEFSTFLEWLKELKLEGLLETARFNIKLKEQKDLVAHITDHLGINVPTEELDIIHQIQYDFGMGKGSLRELTSTYGMRNARYYDVINTNPDLMIKHKVALKNHQDLKRNLIADMRMEIIGNAMEQLAKYTKGSKVVRTVKQKTGTALDPRGRVVDVNEKVVTATEVPTPMKAIEIALKLEGMLEKAEDKTNITINVFDNPQEINVLEAELGEWEEEQSKIVDNIREQEVKKLPESK